MFPKFSTDINLDWRVRDIEEPVTITVSSWIGLNERIYSKVKKALKKQAVSSETAGFIATAVTHHLKEEKKITFEGMIKELEVLCQPDGNITLNGIIIPFILPPNVLTRKIYEPSQSRRIAQATVLWHWRPK
jgi:hypothetical protein